MQLWETTGQDEDPYFFCGGSLISKKVKDDHHCYHTMKSFQHVLTAYHCVEVLDEVAKVEAVIGGICTVPPNKKDWKSQWGLRIKINKGESWHKQ